VCSDAEYPAANCFEGLAISNQRVKTRKITEVPSRRFIVSDSGSFLRFKQTQIYCTTVNEESSIPLVELGKSRIRATLSL
jgi:hypothetical protein